MKNRGFTLIELMIVVAIVAILSAVALPSYRNSIAKSKRAEARGQLLETAQFMQRFYSQNDSYATDRAGNAVTVPTALAAVPKTASTTTGNYTIAFTTTPTVAAFTLTAIARPAGSMGADKCGNYLVNNAGQRSVTGSLSLDECWR